MLHTTRKILAVICVVTILAGLLSVTALGTGDPSPISLQLQNPNWPAYSVAEYKLGVSGKYTDCRWFIQFEGKTYEMTANDTMQPWEAYAGETYGAQNNGLSWFFGGIGPELSGSEIWCELDVGGYTAYSQRAIISVVDEDAGTPPTVRVPSSMVVEQNSVLDLYCEAFTQDGRKLSYSWYETSSGDLRDIRALDARDDANGTENTDTYRVDTSEEGIRYYVCSVDAEGGGSAYSSVIAVQVLGRVIPDPVITTPKNLPDAVVGQPYELWFEMEDPNAEIAEYYNPGKSNDLQATGLELFPSGEFSGTPTEAGTYVFTLCAVGEAGEYYKEFTLKVTEAPASTPDPAVSEAPETSPAPEEETTPVPDDEAKPEATPDAGQPEVPTTGSGGTPIMAAAAAGAVGVGVGVAIATRKKK